MGLGFAGLAQSFPQQAQFRPDGRTMTRAIRAKVTYGTDLAQDDQSGCSGGGGQSMRACGWVEAQS
jgi:hypothetical protein